MEVLKGIYKKGWLRRWKVFGLTFAIGKGCGVKPKWPTGCKKARSINGQRKTNLMSNAHKKKEKLYEYQHHQCWLCGCEMSQRELQIHHILPLYYYPEFASVPDNLLLLCNRCHIHVHHDPLLAAGLVHDVALKLGVTNPRERFLQTITVNYPPQIQITICLKKIQTFKPLKHQTTKNGIAVRQSPISSALGYVPGCTADLPAYR